MTALIHGDYYPDNVLTTEGRVSGIIDWDEARLEWLAYELGRATWEFCNVDQLLDKGAARQFVADYADAGGPIPETEFDHLAPFMRYTRLEDALFDLNQALQGGDWTCEHTEYHHRNLRGMAELGDLGLFP